VAREPIQGREIEVIGMTVGDHYVDGQEALEVDRALRADDHPVLEGILENRVHEDAHGTRLDRDRGVSEQSDLHAGTRCATSGPRDRAGRRYTYIGSRSRSRSQPRATR
jgi:hypothetical protein